MKPKKQQNITIQTNLGNFIKRLNYNMNNRPKKKKRKLLE